MSTKMRLTATVTVLVMTKKKSRSEANNDCTEDECDVYVHHSLSFKKYLTIQVRYYIVYNYTIL